MKMFKRLRETHKLVGILIIIGLISCLFSGCAGTRGAGALGGGHYAASFNIHTNIQVAWDTLLKVLKDDPALFQVDYNKIMIPTDGKEGKVQGEKGMFLITIFVIPQGKDNTTIDVQAGWGIFTDEAVQGSLARAISHQMADKLFSLSTITKQELSVDTAKRMERERFLAMLNTLDETKKQQIISLGREIHKDLEKRDFNSVVQRCKKSIEIDPEDYFAYGTLGGAYAMLNEFDLSIECSAKASQLIPALPDSYIQMVYAYARKGDKDRAFEALQKAVDRGYRNIDHIKNDTDLPEDFRKDTRLNNY